MKTRATSPRPDRSRHAGRAGLGSGRHCSVCGAPGHDARAHRGRRTRRNPVAWDIAANLIGSHVYQKYLDQRGRFGGGKRHKFL